MKKFEIFLALASGVIGFCLALVLFPPARAPQTVEDILTHIRSYDYPQPCFLNHIPAVVAKNTEDEIYASNTQNQYDLVPVGFSKGDVIPKDCFAVQTGLNGTIAQYWRQPILGPEMPVWNPMNQDDLPDWAKTPTQ